MSYWESDPLIYATSADGRLVHVDAVSNGAKCGCMCPACGQPLIARNNGDKLVHHFAHKKGACRWAAETAVIMIARDVLENTGSMCVDGASYLDWVEDICFIFPPDGRLEVRATELVGVGGRQAPALRITAADADGDVHAFVLAAALAQKITLEQIDQMMGCGSGEASDADESAGDGPAAPDDQPSPELEGVLAFDFKTAYANQRDELGRHFSRGEFFLKAQDPELIKSALQGGEGSEMLTWIAHPACEKAEREATERYKAMIRERAAAREAEWERKREEQRREAEREREEEERRAAERMQENIEFERRAFEAEGVEALMKVRHGTNFYIDDCPLYGQADLVLDCGVHVNSPNKCIFFEGQRYYLIGCTARQNGVGLE